MTVQLSETLQLFCSELAICGYNCSYKLRIIAHVDPSPQQISFKSRDLGSEASLPPSAKKELPELSANSDSQTANALAAAIAFPLERARGLRFWTGPELCAHARRRRPGLCGASEVKPATQSGRVIFERGDTHLAYRCTNCTRSRSGLSRLYQR